MQFIKICAVWLFSNIPSSSRENFCWGNIVQRYRSCRTMVLRLQYYIHHSNYLCLPRQLWSENFQRGTKETFDQLTGIHPCMFTMIKLYANSLMYFSKTRQLLHLTSCSMKQILFRWLSENTMLSLSMLPCTQWIGYICTRLLNSLKSMSLQLLPSIHPLHEIPQWSE